MDQVQNPVFKDTPRSSCTYHPVILNGLFLVHPGRPTTSSCYTTNHVILLHDQPRHPATRPTTSSCYTINHVILLYDQPRHPEIVSGSLSNYPVTQSRFCSYVYNWRAGMLASECAAQHDAMPSPAFKSTPRKALPHYVPLQ